MSLSNLIEEKDIFNQRIRELVNLLGKKGLELNAPIGYGIYRSAAGELIVNPP